ncbi:peptidoglycan-associated lipoprotein Pal [Candidatus Symbiobacter mobilis]|uniref:Peptidoglycan-associated lipoprotein n=1 Tax=Candidatus Symbiobacter mobilis CR TaxID=946483 RepID=U5N4W7_9BURK|nr:peptidoglycan-associated lipoprotein Pal [Candidatus Symbiobacter mobilis]AGX86546.1 peptidoglycan-associated lipoprotein [Candidatus Symbiobacter mobilis CR]
MKTWWIAMACVVALAGCATKVPLNEVPVETAEPDPMTQQQDDGAAAVDTAQPAATDLSPATTETVVDGAPLTNIIYFDYDSTMIRPEFQSVVAGHAQKALGNSSLRLVLEGHADEMGSREYNLALGQRRAESVRNSLTILGVPSSQIEAISFGEEKPAVLGASDDAYAKNRRVEVRYP